jgi:succinylglutamate desuccinylase
MACDVAEPLGWCATASDEIPDLSLDRRVIQQLLERFRALATPGPFGYEWAYHHAGNSRHSQHVVIGCVVHGNESGTLPAACELAEALRDGKVTSDGPVTILLGNVDAALVDKRFLEEDFNRVFTFDRPAVSLERRLAERVRPILDSADVFLDIHQTQTPTERPFWTFPWSPDLGHWARALQAAPVALTRAAGQAFSQGTCCLDEYVRNRKRLGITVEIGFRGQDSAQAANASATMRRLIHLVDRVAQGETIKFIGEAAPAVKYYTTAHVVPALTKDHRLRPGLHNWTHVSSGEVLSAANSPELLAPESGFVLFPKYPGPTDPPPPELYRLAREVADPGELT